MSKIWVYLERLSSENMQIRNFLFRASSFGRDRSELEIPRYSLQNRHIFLRNGDEQKRGEREAWVPREGKGANKVS